MLLYDYVVLRNFAPHLSYMICIIIIIISIIIIINICLLLWLLGTQVLIPSEVLALLSVLLGVAEFRIASVPWLLLTVFLLWVTEFQHAIWIAIIITTITAAHSRVSNSVGIAITSGIVIDVIVVVTLLMRNFAFHSPYYLIYC